MNNQERIAAWTNKQVHDHVSRRDDPEEITLLTIGERIAMRKGMHKMSEVQILAGIIAGLEEALVYVNKRESPGVTALNIEVLKKNHQEILDAMLGERNV